MYFLEVQIVKWRAQLASRALRVNPNWRRVPNPLLEIQSADLDFELSSIFERTTQEVGNEDRRSYRRVG